MSVIWANYNDFSRGHPKWWFNKGTSPKSPSFRFRNYTNLPRVMFVYSGDSGMYPYQRTPMGNPYNIRPV